jgi:hypothetical protein
LFIQLLNVGDFRAKTRNLFPKNFKMIHSGQDNASRSRLELRGSTGVLASCFLACFLLRTTL